MQIIKPPASLDNIDPYEHVIFLAGSIEMGAAEDWQSKVQDALAGIPGTILNPRRDDWDSSWEQSINNRQFCNQVEWELTGIADMATVVFFYFQPDTKSPISLMELGLILGQQDITQQEVVVVCPEGFWRKGNVDIICSRYGIEVNDSIESGIAKLKEILERYSYGR